MVTSTVGPRSMNVADRAMHVNVNVASADRAEAFYAATFDLKAHAVTDAAPFDGEQLQLPGMVANDCRLMYDWRGPRASPSIEVMQWLTPPPIGAPHAGLDAPGIQAIAIEVDDVAGIVRRAEAAGATVVGSGSPCVVGSGGDSTTILDPDGVRVEVFTPSRPTGRPPTVRGVALTTAEPELSHAFYTRVGFDDYAPGRDEVRGILGTGETASVRRLTLRDEVPPFVLALCTTPGSPGDRTHGYPSANHLGLFRIALRVDDVHAAIGAVGEHGISVRGPYPVQLTGTRIDPLSIGFMTDPNGVVVEFVERHRRHFRPAVAVDGGGHHSTP